MKSRAFFFAAGVFAALLIGVVLPVSSFAENIEVLFNSVRIALDGTAVSEKGESYVLSNGDTVPYSIVYRGTTYLPMRKIGELLEFDIRYDASTQTAGIYQKGAAPEEVPAPEVKEEPPAQPSASDEPLQAQPVEGGALSMSEFRDLFSFSEEYFLHPDLYYATVNYRKTIGTYSGERSEGEFLAFWDAIPEAERKKLCEDFTYEYWLNFKDIFRISLELFCGKTKIAQVDVPFNGFAYGTIECELNRERLN